jgi:hypothetical protein
MSYAVRVGLDPVDFSGHLALGPDQRAEHKCGEETDQRIQEIADSERVQECHNPRPPVSERPIG